MLKACAICAIVTVLSYLGYAGIVEEDYGALIGMVTILVVIATILPGAIWSSKHHLRKAKRPLYEVKPLDGGDNGTNSIDEEDIKATDNKW